MAKLLVPKKRKTDRQSKNRLHADAILRATACGLRRPRPQAYVGHRPLQWHMPASHRDCRCTVPGDRVPVAVARYITNF